MYLSSMPKRAVGLAAALAMGVALPVLAQEAVPAQPPVAAPDAAPVAAPTATPEAAAAAPAQTAEAPKPAEPPPTLPTTGDGAVVTNLLTQVCRPLVEQGGDLKAMAKKLGLKQDRKSGEYVMALSQKPFQISVVPMGETNKNVCELHVRYAPGWDQPIIDAMNIWRFLHDPQLHLQRNDIGKYTNTQRQTTTWDNWENQAYDGKMIGLIFVQLKGPNGGPVNPNYAEGIIQYSQRKALSQSGVAASLAVPKETSVGAGNPTGAAPPPAS
jgi:hypothetical protein